MLQSQNGPGSEGGGHLTENESEQRSPDDPSSQVRSLETDRPNLSPQISPAAGSRAEVVQLATSAPDNEQPSNGNFIIEPRVIVLAEGEPRYHGPTSTLFEDGSGDRRTQQNVPAIPKIPSAWVQKSLMAEAASQRMLLKPYYFECRLLLKL
jgi:hypothetical protein